MRLRTAVSVVAVSALSSLGIGLASGTASASPPAPNGLTPMLVQLRAAARFYPSFSSLFASAETTIENAAGETTDQLNSDLNGISQGLQQIELQRNQGDPHNGLISTIVDELNAYVNAHGGAPGGSGGGSEGGGGA